MAEDADIGFLFFDLGNGLNIANDNAVRRASQYLDNDLAFDKADVHLGSAKDAIADAIRGRADNGPPDDIPTPNFSDDFDFLL